MSNIDALGAFMRTASREDALREYGDAYGAADDGAPINTDLLRETLINRFGSGIIPEIQQEERDNTVGNRLLYLGAEEG